MKSLFLLIVAALVVFSQVIVFVGSRKNSRDTANAETIITWGTTLHSSRVIQTRLFSEWLKKNGHPDIAAKIDGANVDAKKVIVQGVTGKAADLFDFGGIMTRYIADMGLLADLDGLSEKLDFKKDEYYSGLSNELFFEGKRYAHSANVSLNVYMVNKKAFTGLGLSPPPNRWTFETFEKLGREYVSAANRDLKRRDAFFADRADREVLRRSLGVSWFNETLTASALNSPGYIEVLEKIYRWTYEDHLFPTAADLANLSTELSAGFGGASTQLFHQGKLAMFLTGTWFLVSLRELPGQMSLTAVEPPHGGFPNTDLLGRVITVYQGSQHKEAAGLFIKFLSSEEFNLNVVESGDGYPPNPAFLYREELLHPPRHTNEWELQERSAQAAKTIAFCREYSPFAQFSVYSKFDSSLFGGFIAGLYSAAEMAQKDASQMNKHIADYVAKRNHLKEAFAKALEKQKTIDALKARGEKIPLNLVDNPVLKRYYRETGRGL